MEQLHHQVARAYRRLLLQRFVNALGICCFATLLAAATAIGLSKVFVLEIDGAAIDPGTWAGAWLVGALVAGLVLAAGWTWITRPRTLEAALEIDRRFGLKERVSSTLALDGAELDTAAGRALLADAIRRVERVRIGEKFGIALPRRSLLPLAPAVVAAGLTLLPQPVSESQVAAAAAIQVSKQIKDSTEPLRRKFDQQKKEAEDKGLTEASELFKKLEEGMRDLTRGEKADRKEALSKLNDLARELEQRRQQLGGDDKLRQQLQQLGNVRQGPADKLAQAVKQGDFQKALEQIDKLREELKNGQLDEAKKAELAEQLAQMQQALQKMADDQQRLAENLQKQIDQMKQAGREGDAQKLQQQLDQMQQQAGQMQALEQIAQQLGECAECLGNGQGEQAQAALDKLAGQLGDLQAQSEEMQMLADALDELGMCRDAMNCGQCQGQGCAACQGRGMGQGNEYRLGQGGGDGGPGIGNMPGGPGNPPDPIEGKFYDAQVRQQVGPGAGTIAGQVGGPNLKGDARQAIHDVVESARQDAADALTNQHLPRQQRDHARQYFDALREGR